MKSTQLMYMCGWHSLILRLSRPKAGAGKNGNEAMDDIQGYKFI